MDTMTRKERREARIREIAAQAASLTPEERSRLLDYNGEKAAYRARVGLIRRLQIEGKDPMAIIEYLEMVADGRLAEVKQ